MAMNDRWAKLIEPPDPDRERRYWHILMMAPIPYRPEPLAVGILHAPERGDGLPPFGPWRRYRKNHGTYVRRKL